MLNSILRMVSRKVVMVAMWADSPLGSGSSAPSTARALTAACRVAPISRHWSKPCRSA
jgi:hypothetical protein